MCLLDVNSWMLFCLAWSRERGRDYALDWEGYDFPSVEVALHKAMRAARKAWARMAPGQDPHLYAIEVEHESGVMVLSLPFAEVLAADLEGERR